MLWIACKISSAGFCVWTLGPQQVTLFWKTVEMWVWGGRPLMVGSPSAEFFAAWYGYQEKQQLLPQACLVLPCLLQRTFLPDTVSWNQLFLPMFTSVFLHFCYHCENSNNPLPVINTSCVSGRYNRCSSLFIYFLVMLTSYKCSTFASVSRPLCRK